MDQVITWTKKMLEFNILLALNTYTSYSSLMIELPIQIEKRTNVAQNIDTTMITVNNFFMHWLREVDIKRYPDDIHILPINNTISIYRYLEKNAEASTSKIARHNQGNAAL